MRINVPVDRERVSAIDDILRERNFQDQKWGAVKDGCFDDRPFEKWLTILVEEVGEVAEAILERDDNLRKELVQVAAVAVATIEALDRRNRW